MVWYRLSMHANGDVWRGLESWQELARQLGTTPDAAGWLRVTRRRRFVLQRVQIDDWQLVLVQTSVAREEALDTASAVTRLVPFPLGALVLSDGVWVLRHALSLDGLTLSRIEQTLRCLDIQSRKLIAPTQSTGSNELFDNYAD
jgi:hypothetical protein